MTLTMLERPAVEPTAGRADPVCGTSFGSGCAFGLHGYHVCGEPTGHGGPHCCTFDGTAG